MKNFQHTGSVKTYNYCLMYLLAIMVFVLFSASFAFGAEILFVVGKKDLMAGDLAIKNHLENKGRNVIVIEDTIVENEDAVGKDLVILSESARSRYITTKFRNTAVPLICSEPWIYNNLGMTAGTKKIDFGRKSHQKEFIILNAAHPLCASCSEEVQVCSKNFFMGWGVPGENAIAVAALSKDHDKCTIFAYEAGVEMPGLVAPARRVGLFLFRNTAKFFTKDGWALFDSAVDWAIPNSETALTTKLQPNVPDNFHQ